MRAINPAINGFAAEQTSRIKFNSVLKVAFSKILSQ